MKKETYLQSLKDYLSGRISDRELNDILSDYEGFFLTGTEEGKTEDEISEELGNPEDIARSLIEEGGKELSLCYAPVYKRIPALIIDVIVAGLPFIWFAPNTAIGSYFMPQVMSNMIPALLSTVKCSNHTWISQVRPFWIAAIIASALWFFFINPLCMIIFKGYTLGKKIMKIRVVSADGTRANPVQIIIRECIGKYFVNMLGSLIPNSIFQLLPSAVSLIWACASKEHRTIHDTIARTCVIDCQEQESGRR